MKERFFFGRKVWEEESKKRRRVSGDGKEENDELIWVKHLL